VKIEEVITRNLREYRRQRGLTQEAVAGRANLQSNYYACVERGQKMLSIPSLVKIAKVLKVDAYKLLMPDSADKTATS
jgi:XRE family transcriptional regulator, regulator of sulfur utilization